jgi:UDP-N-acetylglucosamine 1-carboxyvinyltransferase
MDRIAVRGRGSLRGEVSASGSKNSTLALMAGALLARGETHLSNVPRLRDVSAMLEILRALGARAQWHPDDDHAVLIDASTIRNPEAPYDLVRKMRASFLVLGPLLARFGAARVSEPGGCAIGVRPVDQHLKGLRALGAKLTSITATSRPPLRASTGGRVTFDLNTVNGTQNVLMAACLAEGETVIENAAREPEVVELAHVLQKMGAEIHGAGSDRITVQGVRALRGVRHRVAGDRIEAGTLLAAVVIAGGDVRVVGVDPADMQATLDKLAECGAELASTRRACTCAWRVRRSRFRSLRRRSRDSPPTCRRRSWPCCAWRRALRGHRARVREPLHARARAPAHGRRHHALGTRRARARSGAALGCAGDGHRSARIGRAGRGGARGRRRNYHQPRLPHRSRLRAHRGEAPPPRADIRREG